MKIRIKTSDLIDKLEAKKALVVARRKKLADEIKQVNATAKSKQMAAVKEAIKTLQAVVASGKTGFESGGLLTLGPPRLTSKKGTKFGSAVHVPVKGLYNEMCVEGRHGQDEYFKRAIRDYENMIDTLKMAVDDEIVIDEHDRDSYGPRLMALLNGHSY